MGALSRPHAAALGNHEYGTLGRAGDRLLRPSSARLVCLLLGAWRIVAQLELQPGRRLRSRFPAVALVASELAARPRRCTLAYMHHPRWSSGLHGSDGTMSELWRLLASARADVLAGHDHHYERFAPIDGIRSFVVGTGGKSHYPVLQRLPSSRAYDWTTFGVLRLELRADGYAWRF